MNKNQSAHIHDLSNDISTDLIQRIMNGDLNIHDAMDVLAQSPMMMMYRTLPEEVVDDTLKRHAPLVLLFAETFNGYLKDNPMQLHEFITMMARTYELLLSQGV